MTQEWFRIKAEAKRTMEDADRAYQLELVRVYGERQAGDARYLPKHSDVAVSVAQGAYHAAHRAWVSAGAFVVSR